MPKAFHLFLSLFLSLSLEIPARGNQSGIISSLPPQGSGLVNPSLTPAIVPHKAFFALEIEPVSLAV
jgi:hypothetical protein